MPFDWSNRSSVERLIIIHYASVYTFTFTLNCHLGKTHKGNNAEDTVQSSHFYITHRHDPFRGLLGNRAMPRLS